MRSQVLYWAAEVLYANISASHVSLSLQNRDWQGRQVRDGKRESLYNAVYAGEFADD